MNKQINAYLFVKGELNDQKYRIRNIKMFLVLWIIEMRLVRKLDENWYQSWKVIYKFKDCKRLRQQYE